MDFLIAFIARFKRIRILQLFTVYLRYLIGGGFVIAAIGMGKLSGGVYMLSADAKPIEELEPIQQFFRVMTDSGLYWQFIGWTQIVGGFLLMTQRFAKLGALIFFGLILNIFVITVSYEFRGTPIVTGLMLLATAYLILWDLDSLQYIIRKPGEQNFSKATSLAIGDQPFWGLQGLVLFGIIIGVMVMRAGPVVAMLTPLVAGLAGLVLFFILYRKQVFSREPMGA
jgi:hypothetical protein